MAQIELPELQRDEYFLTAKVRLLSHPSVIEILIDADDFDSYLQAFYLDFRDSDLPSVSTLDAWARDQFLDCPVDPADYDLTHEAAHEIENHYRMTTIEFLSGAITSKRQIRLGGDCVWDPEHGLECYIHNGRIAGIFDTDLPA